jgi:ferredoxin
MFKCNFGDKFDQFSTWQNIKNAYVPATTVCYQKIKTNTFKKPKSINSNSNLLYERNLSVGENISAIIPGKLKVTFNSITSSGTLYFSEITNDSGYYYFDIYTTAVYSGDVTICLKIPDGLNQNNARLVRVLEDGSFEDVTTSVSYRTICGVFPSIGFRALDEGSITRFDPVLVISDPSSQAGTYAQDQFTIITSGGNSAQVVTNSDGEIIDIVWGFDYEDCDPPKSIGGFNIDNIFDTLDCGCWETVLSLGALADIISYIVIAWTTVKAAFAAAKAAGLALKLLWDDLGQKVAEIGLKQAAIKASQGVINNIKGKLGPLERKMHDIYDEIAELDPLDLGPEHLDDWQKKHYWDLQNELGPIGKEVDKLTGELNAEIQNQSSLFDDFLVLSDEEEAIKASIAATKAQQEGFLASAFATLALINAAYESIRSIPVLSQQKQCNDEGQTLGEDCECYYNVTVIRESDSVDFRVKNNDTILEAAEINQVNLPFACRAGSCSSCVMKKVSGCIDQEEQSFLDDDMIKHCYTTTCVARPKSDLVLDSTQLLNIYNWDNEKNEIPGCPDATVDGCCDCPPPNNGDG